MTSPNPSPSLPRSSFPKAWLLWGLLFLVIAFLVGTRPESRTVTPEYRGAAEHWIDSVDLYDLTTIHGFLYFPVSALVYLPILPFPLWAGEILWRLLLIGSLTWGVWRVACLQKVLPPEKAFGIMSLLTLPACLASARNGQTNMALAAVFLHIVVEITNQRWNWTTLLLMITLILKPISLVLILLCWAVYSPLRWRLCVGLILFIALPWIHLHPEFVWRQHQLFWQKLQLAGNPVENNYCDLRGLLLTVGLPVNEPSLKPLRALAALLVLGLCLRSARNLTRPELAVNLTAWAATYLMIFNPRNETNSFVLLAPFLAYYAVATGLGKQRFWKSPPMAFVLIILALALGVDSYGKSIFVFTNLWLKVSVALVFAGLLASGVFWNKSKIVNKSLHT